MRRQSRIRWTAEERDAVVRRAQTLLAQHPALTTSALFKESQNVLPKERHRTAFGTAVSWLKFELAKAGPLPSPVEITRPIDLSQETANATPAATLESASSQDAHAGAATSTSPAALPQQSPVLDQLVDVGVQLVTRVLTDARVKAAVAALLQSAFPQPLAPPDTALDADSSASQGQPREFVVVAGCSESEAKKLAKEINGTLNVRFWACDEPRERLLELLPQAELVIGVAGALPKVLDSTLSRLGSRYIRHQGDAKGLYRRLAEQAMR